MPLKVTLDVAPMFSVALVLLLSPSQPMCRLLNCTVEPAPMFSTGVIRVFCTWLPNSRFVLALTENFPAPGVLLKVNP